MRKWRDLFNVTQIEVANILDLSSSVISDYEKGRRRSPGSNFIKRYVEALLEIDSKHGGIKIPKTFS
jgi:putative transcriptional regulator